MNRDLNRTAASALALTGLASCAAVRIVSRAVVVVGIVGDSAS